MSKPENLDNIWVQNWVPRGWTWSDQVCRCGGLYGTLARYKEALLEGTIPPRYYIERLPALLYDQGYIHMVQVCHIV